MNLLLKFFIAAVLAFVALYAYSQKRIVAEDFALGSENTHVFEQWNGDSFTASTVDDICSLVRREATNQEKTDKKYILWLGNSQLHTINQFKSGDHLAPYWLRADVARPDNFVPLGLSLPNANLQEHFIISEFVKSHLPLRALILEVVFDDLREDDLRDEFSAMLTPETRGKIATLPIGEEILSRTKATEKSGNSKENIGLQGFVQKNFEDILTQRLGSVWPLWEERQNLRVSFLIDLYFARNYVFGIKPTSVRRMIPSRYERNMKALEAMLADFQHEKIPVVIYIAPIRQDQHLPYDANEYESWKKKVAVLAQTYSASFLNLEALVPPSLWGTYHKDDIDFMHFQGEGHKLVAKAILPALERVLKVNKERAF